MQTDSELDIRYEQLSCPSLMDLDIQFVDEGHSEQGKEVFSFQNTSSAPVFEEAAAPDELLWCIANDIGNGVVDETWVWGAGAAQSKEEAL
ncbi:MAG: hypothetical protein EZS28_020816, partial [Streblomastix strix]